jgi:pentatricopeptide repeat protein
MDFFENEIENEGYIPNVSDLNFFISYYCTHDEIDFALQLMNQFETKFGIVCGSIEYNNFVVAYLQSGQDEKAMEIFYKMKKMSVAPNYYTYERLLGYYIEKNEMGKIVEVLALWKKDALIRNSGMSLVENYIKAQPFSNYLNCIDFLDKLARSRLNDDSFYIAFFHKFVYSDAENSMRYFKLLEDKGQINCVRNSRLFNYLVVRYLEIEDNEKSQYVWNRIPRGRIRLDTTLSVIKNHFNNNEYDKAMDIFDKVLVIQQRAILKQLPEYFKEKKILSREENKRNIRIKRLDFLRERAEKRMRLQGGETPVKQEGGESQEEQEGGESQEEQEFGENGSGSQEEEGQHKN